MMPDPEILEMGKEPILGLGVRGYIVEEHDAIYIPLIIADKPGNGDVGRYLDSLSRSRTIRIPNVLNPILEGMLERRGFCLTIEDDPDYGAVEVWERKALAQGLQAQTAAGETP